ncbi:hypothetical protein M378DRAFT_89472, partial [Amanita muscaria Koide BX008]
MINEDGLEADGITDEQIQAKIPQHLRYACTYWVNHLEVANMEDEALRNRLEMFAYGHMLYWLEVLSLIGQLDSAHRDISVVLKLLTSTPSALYQLLSDALRFISKFYEIIKRSALHTYYSALAFTPTNSLLYRQYIKEAEHNICSIEGGPEKWDALVAKLRHDQRWFIPPAFSPDCTHLAVRDLNDNVNLWDIRGIDASSPPSKRNATAVSVLTLSRDCSRLACGFEDGTVELWETSPTNRRIDPLALRSKMEKFFFRIFRQSRHTEPVQVLEFDPDGRLFASGSYDGTIKLWNGGDGALRGTLRAPGG